ncbi:MAG: hypothetical protein CMO06_06905 [Thalassospira sp.]|uniref:hypothetical protein n=1 Tax=Thalassospira sp. TaxID=1912094 RepID=UPI000C505E46|nr:hypothetical protein [Thalassospira sp.]MAZ32859.1 hypothetical protein [Thalassospira sp.]|tara:strand:- start:1817 stop:2452 length:636 start_codon:yes stop_codon:yes gene_type:complete
MQELIELSWQTQIVIVSGYLSYVLAYSGMRSEHKTIDSVSIVLCFGGLGLLIIHTIDPLIGEDFRFENVVLGISGVVVPIIFAVLWRKLFRENFGKFWRWTGVSEEDGLPTAWNTLIQKRGLLYTQINVTTKDGRVLESWPLEPFNNDPNGPCVLGADGSIGMYVTHITEVGEERREVRKLRDDNGIRITYIPKDQIAEVDLRRSFKKRSN